MILQFKHGPELLFSVFADSVPRVGETVTHSLAHYSDRSQFNADFLERCDNLRGKHWRVLHVDYEYTVKAVGTEPIAARIFVEPARDPYTDESYLIQKVQSIIRNVRPIALAYATNPEYIGCTVVANTDDRVTHLVRLLVEAGMPDAIDMLNTNDYDHRLLRGKTRYLALIDKASWGANEELHDTMLRTMQSSAARSGVSAKSLMLFL